MYEKAEELDKTILKKNIVGGTTAPAFKTYYIATVIKTMWHWGEGGRENSELRNKSYTCAPQLSDKGTAAAYWREEF